MADGGGWWDDADSSNCRWFWFWVLLAELAGLGLLVSLVWWTTCVKDATFDNGLDQSFYYHPLFMVLGMVLITGQALIAFRVFGRSNKANVKWLHAICMVVSVFLMALGLSAANAHGPPPTDFWHVLMGIIAVALFFLQLFLGVLGKVLFWLPDWLSRWYAPVHNWMGALAFVLAAVAAATGLTITAELGSRYITDLWSVASTLCCVLLVCMLVYAVCVMAIICNRDYREQGWRANDDYEQHLIGYDQRGYGGIDDGDESAGQWEREPSCWGNFSLWWMSDGELREFRRTGSVSGRSRGSRTSTRTPRPPSQFEIHDGDKHYLLDRSPSRRSSPRRYQYDEEVKILTPSERPWQTLAHHSDEVPVPRHAPPEQRLVVPAAKPAAVVKTVEPPPPPPEEEQPVLPRRSWFSRTREPRLSLDAPHAQVQIQEPVVESRVSIAAPPRPIREAYGDSSTEAPHHRELIGSYYADAPPPPRAAPAVGYRRFGQVSRQGSSRRSSRPVSAAYEPQQQQQQQQQSSTSRSPPRRQPSKTLFDWVAESDEQAAIADTHQHF